MVCFYGWSSTVWRPQSLYEMTVHFLPLSLQEFLILIWSTSEGWKTVLPWSHPVVLNMVFWSFQKKRCGSIHCWRSISMIIRSMHFNYHISISLGIMVLVKVNAKSDLSANLLSTMHVCTSRNMVARTPWTYLYVTALINWDQSLTKNIHLSQQRV